MQEYPKTVSIQIPMNKTHIYKMSAETREELLHYYTNINNNGSRKNYFEKRDGLLMLGLPEAEVERMCETKPATQEQINEILCIGIQEHQKEMKAQERRAKRITEQERQAKAISSIFDQRPWTVLELPGICNDSSN
jgi:hypothetical protein